MEESAVLKAVETWGSTKSTKVHSQNNTVGFCKLFNLTLVDWVYSVEHLLLHQWVPKLWADPRSGS
jgi:hypothetical protein